VLVGSGTERQDGWGGHLLGAGRGIGVADRAKPAAGEDVEAEVAAAFGPFIVLLGQRG
jgi:hypothetical protein